MLCRNKSGNMEQAGEVVNSSFVHNFKIKIVKEKTVIRMSMKVHNKSYRVCDKTL